MLFLREEDESGMERKGKAIQAGEHEKENWNNEM